MSWGEGSCKFYFGDEKCPSSDCRFETCNKTCPHYISRHETSTEHAEAQAGNSTVEPPKRNRQQRRADAKWQRVLDTKMRKRKEREFETQQKWAARKAHEIEQRNSRKPISLAEAERLNEIMRVDRPISIRSEK
jgi:hypothetical protein